MSAILSVAPVAALQEYYAEVQLRVKTTEVGRRTN
jgi:hypothetical protein